MITAMISCAGLALALALLWIVGRVTLVAASVENHNAASLVDNFHHDLVRFANSNGDDQAAYTELVLKSTSVEKALGGDNYVTGARVGWYMMQNAPLLPLAIQEMRRHFGNSVWGKDGHSAAEVVEGVLLRHLGRRRGWDQDFQRDISSVRACIATGWSVVAAFPISILEAFGLLTKGKGQSARRSIVFRLWSLLLAICALAGPALAYLADRDKIDLAIRALWP